MPRHPMLGIPGSKPRLGPSIAQLLKAAEENAPKPTEAKPLGAKAKALRGRGIFVEGAIPVPAVAATEIE